MEGMGLGKRITGKQYRDAIHIAVAPATAGEDMTRGDWVKRAGDVFVKVDMDDWEDMRNCIGIVDPYLCDWRGKDQDRATEYEVKKGEQFWLFLKPLTVTSIRHVWSHPLVPNEDGVNVDPDYEILACVASECGKSYNAFIADLTDFVSSNRGSQWPDYIMDNSERYKDATGDWKKVWQAWARVTGMQPLDGHAEHAPYSCSC